MGNYDELLLRAYDIVDNSYKRYEKLISNRRRLSRYKNHKRLQHKFNWTYAINNALDTITDDPTEISEIMFNMLDNDSRIALENGEISDDRFEEYYDETFPFLYESLKEDLCDRYDLRELYPFTEYFVPIM